MRTITVTCVADDCENAGHAITLEVDDDVSAVVCGPCGADLTPTVSAS